jgi:acyl-ACP dehydrogenase
MNTERAAVESEAVRRTAVEPGSYSSLLDEAFGPEVRGLVAEAERSGNFPRRVIELLGAAGVFERKWRDRSLPDVAALLDLGSRLGGLASLGVAVGVSLHDAAIAILRRFGRSSHLAATAERAIAGETVLCIAASESGGGSDLGNVTTTAAPENGGFRVRGHKKFVSLSPIADVILVVARMDGPGPDGGPSDGLGVFAVPVPSVTVGRAYRTVGTKCLDTAPVEIDVWVPAEAAVGRPGTGLAVISWGLAHERLSVASQVVGVCDVALGVTVARMKSRRQFGSQLFDHQALRLRVADLSARLDVLRWALRGVADAGRLDIRTASAFKVTSVRLGNELLSECMHIFGGTGYLLDQSPLGRWFMDMKLGRVGGGADEVLWELVAAGLKPDFDRYSEFVQET